MPRIPEKFEDWTPPWGDDEIDPEKITKLVYDLKLSEQTLTADKRKLSSEVRDLESTNVELEKAVETYKAASTTSTDENKAAIEKAVSEAVEAEKKRADEAEGKLKDAELVNWKLEAQVKFPDLEDDDFKRISGDTLEDFLADAEEFVSRLGPVDDGDGDLNEEPNPLERQPKRRRTSLDPEPTLRPSSLDQLNERLAAQTIPW